MLFNAIFFITFFSLMWKVLPFCKYLYFLLYPPPRIARLIARGEKYFKQYDFVNKVLLLLLLRRVKKSGDVMRRNELQVQVAIRQVFSIHLGIKDG